MGNDEVGRKYLDGQAPAHLQNTRPGQVHGYVQIISGDPIRQADVGPAPRTGMDVSEGDTAMCVHCQRHWIIKPGSGAVRGFCAKCNGVTCGKMKCENECLPFARELELMEGADPNATRSFPGAHIL